MGQGLGDSDNLCIAEPSHTTLRHPNPNLVLAPESLSYWNLGKIIEIF